MKLFNDCWIAILQLLDTLTLSTTGRSALQNSPAGLEINPSSTPNYPLPGTGRPNEGFIPFTPPSSAEDQDKSIACKYPSLGDEWEFCGEENRGCWIRNRKNSSELFDISTNYEEKFRPGVLRKFYLEASNIPIDADGVENKEGKVFNRTYPGPWIEACWGDVIEVTVKNNLRWNGTTVHWHGIRQLHTLEMDGVNAVTQCPIAPGQNYTYRFRAMQYDSSWYHSHYSMQSGFQDFQKELENKGPPNMDSILINGIGSYAGIAKGGKRFTTTFVKGTKYLLRLINTSVDTTLVFSIDSHSMTVITADFVPIHPYITDHLVIGIGQRYHVVIEANPKYLIHQNAGYENSYGDYIDSPEAFWIRTIPANGCEKFLLGGKPDERQGIIRYENPHDRSPLDPSVPTTGRRNFSLQCRDEEFENLKPWRKWYVGGNEKNEIPDKRTFRTGTQIQEGVPTSIDKFAKWAIGSEPMYLNFSNPTILELNKTANSWASTRVVIPENAPENTWVYLAIISDEVHRLVGPRLVVPAAHPIHLHGHDFALVQQSTEPWSETIVNITRDNPPRRDVVLLPQNGFIIIAFKADNPGAWLLHCHIAWHASSGLAMQILERQADAAQAMTPARLKPVEDGCKTWDEWFSNSTNLYHHNHTTFQDDSGI